MQHSVPPFLAAFLGVLAAMFFMSPLVHWLALIQSTLAKHGGVSPGPAKRRLLTVVPFAVFLHPVPYLVVALVFISVRTVSGSVSSDWWWFLGGLYLYAAGISLLVLSWHAPATVGDAEANKRRIWPFDVLARRNYDRQYRAACAMFLVQCSFARLSVAQQADILQRVRTMLLLLGVNIYVVPPNSPWLTFIFAAQMKALGIPTALEGEPWPLPDRFAMPVLKPNLVAVWTPRRLTKLFWKGVYLWNVSRRGGRPVEAARADMIARGLDVSSSSSWHEWPPARKGTQGN